MSDNEIPPGPYATPERDGNLGEVIDQRVAVYGNPVETFARIAEVWSGILGTTVNATDVPLCLMGMKMVRTTQAPDYSDNSDDIEGYLDIFRQLVGEDMVHARSVKEYIEMKNARGVLGLMPVTAEDFELDEPEQVQSTGPTHVAGCLGDHGPMHPCLVPRPKPPISAVDAQFCISYGYHRATAKHTFDECPVKQAEQPEQVTITNTCICPGGGVRQVRCPIHGVLP